MARTGSDESVLSLAVALSNSLRTTVPIHIVNQLELKKGDKIKWRLDKVNTEWIATIQKKERNEIEN